MADYDCGHPRSTTSSSLKTAVSTAQALPSSTTESTWDGWTQALAPVSDCTLSEQLQQKLGGGSYNSSARTKSGSSYQHDLLTSWLMSGYQTVSLTKQQQQHHGAEEGPRITTIYEEEFSRMNMCSSTSSDYDGVVSPPIAEGRGGSGASHQLSDVLQACSSSVQTCHNSGLTTEVGESSQFLTSPPSPDHNLEAAAHKFDVSANQKMHQINSTTELSSRASSSSPPCGLNSNGTTMQQQHLGGQFDSSTYWATTGSKAALTSSSLQPSDCRGGGMRSWDQQRGEQQPNTSCDSIILHLQQHHSSKNRCKSNDTLFHNSGTDLTVDQMYNELHGLFSKSLEAAAHGDPVDHSHQQQLAICSGGVDAPAGTYGDHSSWTQFHVHPSLAAPSSHAGGFIVDPTMFNGCTTSDTLSTATHATTRRDDLSNSSAGTAMSTIHNFNVGPAVDTDLNHTALPYKSLAADLDCPDMGLERKRPLSRGAEHVGETGVSAREDSAKRSCIEHHRNLWQLQSQALFGRLPGSFLMGGNSSSNSGSMDMTPAVEPALNTNGRPRARRGSATDPQSVYARHRRERINDRLKVLQHLVPNGGKVDNVTMLEEAINYVKFLQLQVRLLSSDELWIYAPTTYNGVDVSMGMHTGLLNQQA